MVGTAVIGLLVFADLSIRDDAPALAPIEVWLTDLAVIALAAFIVSLPLGLPTIIISEKKHFGSIWVFLCLAFVHSLIFSFWSYFASTRMDWGLSLFITLPFLAGWLTYWAIAWRLYPPEDIAEERQFS
ncbi:MAG: hypothetical protein C0510_04330 [Erythrobacter sp.]|nr:hypothetical protein [Erythrobacter sp.]